jgi:hypothetical protein
MKTARKGFPWAAAGECLLALTRQPLRRPGQPKAAAPDSCIRVASAPGERSYIHGKPMAETGQSYFPGHSAMRSRCPGDGARIPAGARRPVRRDSMRALALDVTGAFGGTPAFARTSFAAERQRRETGLCHSAAARTETYDGDAA